MAEAIIRDASLGDCDEIFRLLKESIIHEDIGDPFKVTIDTFRRGFENKTRFNCIIAEDQKPESPKVIGFIIYTWMYETWESDYFMHIEGIFVTEGHRKHGIGTALFERAVKVAATEGFKRMQLFVKDSNIAAMNLCKKIGAFNATEAWEWNVVNLLGDTIKSNIEIINNRLLSEGPARLERTTIRNACVEDCGEILCLLKDLTVHEEAGDRYKVNEEIFRRDGFGEKRLFNCFVAVDDDDDVSDRPRLIGFLLYTWMYKAWLGSDVMYIEDLFVTKEKRGQGVGTALFERAIKTAATEGYYRMRLTARMCNTRAMKFYKKFGVVNTSEEQRLNFLMIENL